jgi:hypothetical protein
MLMVYILIVSFQKKLYRSIKNSLVLDISTVSSENRKVVGNLCSLNSYSYNKLEMHTIENQNYRIIQNAFPHLL